MEVEPFSSFGKEKGGTEMIGGRVYTLSFLSQGSPKKYRFEKKTAAPNNSPKHFFGCTTKKLHRLRRCEATS